MNSLRPPSTLRRLAVWLAGHGPLSQRRRWLIWLGLLFGLLSGLGPRLTVAQQTNSDESTGKKGQDKYALLIGISDYRQRSVHAWPDLHGADDVQAMKEALLVRGFLDSHICVLTNQQATLAGITKDFRRCLTAFARKDAALVFYYSGHGEQLPDDNGDEDDQLDEALVPYDWDRGPEKRNFLRDDALADLLSEARAKMLDSTGALQGDLVVLLDSCFSGSATRGGGDRAPIYRGLAPAATGGSVERMRSSLKTDRIGLLESRPGSADVIVLSAAQSGESAVELLFENSPTPRGLFTYAVAEALKSSPGPRSYRALFEMVLAFVSGRMPSQHPVLEGSPDATSRGLFAEQSPLEGHYIPVVGIDERGLSVTLPLGSLHGATLHSRFALFPQSQVLPLRVTRCDAQAGCLGEAALTEVGATKSTAKLTTAPFPLAKLVAGRAVEIAHSHPDVPPIKVYLAPGTPVRRTLFEPEADAVLVAGSETDYDVRVELRDGRLIAAPKDALPGDTASELFSKPLLAGTGSGARTVLSDAVQSELVVALRAQYQTRYLRQLKGGSAALAMGLRLQSIGDATGPGHAPDAKDWSDQDEVYLEVQNEGGSPAFVSIVELTAQGGINVLCPHPRQQRGALNNQVPIGKAWKRLDCRVRLNTPGRMLWKLLITEQPADFSVLDSRVVRKGHDADHAVAGLPASAQPLGKLLLNAGVRLRSESVYTPTDGWATRDYELRVRPTSSLKR